jgi:hypothetical protein
MRIVSGRFLGAVFCDGLLGRVGGVVTAGGGEGPMVDGDR